MDLKNLN